jgi:hypothetical protein
VVWTNSVVVVFDLLLRSPLANGNHRIGAESGEQRRLVVCQQRVIPEQA